MQTSNNNSTVQLFKDIVRTEGFKGFFNGLASPLIGAVGINALTFYALNKSLDLLQRPGEERKTFNNIFFASIATGAALVVAECPVELIKAKMQAKAYSPSYLAARAGREPTTVSLAAHILRENRYNPRYIF
jgi:solute carrier family 25 (mitochondrial carnitine/acylcarnitine transporter), member 20/29